MVRVLEVNGLHRDRLTCVHSLGNFYRQLFFFSGHAALSYRIDRMQSAETLNIGLVGFSAVTNSSIAASNAVAT